MSTHDKRVWTSGIGNVGSYQASSVPYVSASLNVSSSGDIVRIDFPKVTGFVTVKNIGPEGATDCLMRVGFSENGIANNNYFLLNNEESYSADWKLSAIYLRVHDLSGALNATASVIAGVTNISTLDLPNNWSGSTGVG